MSQYFIKIEGQSIPVPTEVGSSDEHIKSTLSQHYEGITNALIRRKTQPNGDIHAEVCKQAGPKG
jgi:hypothetical protein